MDPAGEWCSLYDAEVSALRTLASDGIGDVPCIYSCKADSALSQASICMNLLNLGSADRWATKGRPCPEPWLAHVAYTLLQVKWIVCIHQGMMRVYSAHLNCNLAEVAPAVSAIDTPTLHFDLDL